MSTRTGLILAGTMLLAASSQAALVPASGYTAQSIYSSAGSFSTLGGLDVFNGRVYTGQFTDIVSVNTDGTGAASEGTVPSNAGNSLVSVRPSDGRVFTAFTTSYAAPAPSEVGYMGGGTFVGQTATVDGVYDSARDASGNLFLSANDDVDGDNLADGSRIYLYDQASGGVTEVANLGGFSGGLALASNGDLYYSAYEDNKIASFSAAQVGAVLAGGASLTLSDAASEIVLAGPGFLAFDSADQLYASHLDASWATHLVALDADGSTTSIADGGGKLVVDGDTLYTIDTDWNAYASDIYAVKAIPEPGTITLVLMSGAGLLVFRKRRKHYLRV